MTEADVIQPSASIASTGLGIRYIGDEHCYAYSGEITVSSSGHTMLEFTSGSGYIVGTIQFLYSGAFSAVMSYQILLNNIVVGAYSNGGSVAATGPEPDTPIPILIPPHTILKVTATSDSSSRDQSALLIGRVYGAT